MKTLPLQSSELPLIFLFKMKCLTHNECKDWSSKRLIQIKDNELIFFSSDPIFIRIPKHSSRQAVLASLIINLPEVFNGGLLWLKEWGVWPSQESRVLIDRFRLSYNEKRSLNEAPGHLFYLDEKEEALGILRLVILFGWGAYFIKEDGNYLSFVSHDELTIIDSKNREKLAEIKKLCVKSWAFKNT